MSLTKINRTVSVEVKLLQRWQRLAALNIGSDFFNEMLKEHASAFLAKHRREKRHFKRGLK